MIDTRRDFTANWRLLGMAAIAAPIGFVSTAAAFGLLALIRLFTNVFFFQMLSFVPRSPAQNHLGLWVIPIPVVGGLLIGLMARFGSEKIRGHGIPEALEAILFGKSRMSPTVALLKHQGSGGEKPVGDLFGENIPVMALPDETCRAIATRLAVHHLERIPVVQHAESRELIGLVSRSDLVNPSLSLFDEEHNYETFHATAVSSLKDVFRRR